MLLCRHWPIFPARRQASIFGTAELNFRVRNGNGWTLCVKNTDLSGCRKPAPDGCVSTDLFSRPVARQVSSALQSLTSVFGMGTGGPSALKALTFSQYNGRKAPCIATLRLYHSPLEMSIVFWKIFFRFQSSNAIHASENKKRFGRDWLFFWACLFQKSRKTRQIESYYENNMQNNRR